MRSDEIVRGEGRLQNAADRMAQKPAVVTVVVTALGLEPYGPLGAAAPKTAAGAQAEQIVVFLEHF